MLFFNVIPLHLMVNKITDGEKYQDYKSPSERKRGEFCDSWWSTNMQHVLRGNAREWVQGVG